LASDVTRFIFRAVDLNSKGESGTLTEKENYAHSITWIVHMPFNWVSDYPYSKFVI
jgi:hypothetical protein